MTEIILHFEAEAGTDTEAVAADLQKAAAAMAGVEKAAAEPDEARDMATVQEVILYLTLAGTVLQTGATTLDALKKFIVSAKGVAGALGLGNPRVEVGLSQVAPEELTEEQAKALHSRG